MKKIFITVGIFLFLGIWFTNFGAFASECEDIRENVLRLHILANSNTDEDQQLKIEVRDIILQHSEDWFCVYTSKDEAVKNTINQIEQIQEIAQEYVYSQGYDYIVSAEVCNTFFTTREYTDFTLPAGYYDALRINIGEAQGENWWCVLYPALCLGSVSSTQQLATEFSQVQINIITDSTEKYRVSFAILELFEKIYDWFK